MRRGHLPKEINNLRLGECLLLGRDMAFDVDIEGLSQDTMRLEAELVEVRAKRTLPVGEIGHDAFGNVPVFVDHGTRRQGILAVGKQDVNVLGLTPLDEGVKIKDGVERPSARRHRGAARPEGRRRAELPPRLHGHALGLDLGVRGEGFRERRRVAAERGTLAAERIEKRKGKVIPLPLFSCFLLL